MEIKLSVLIPSLPERMSHLTPLIAELERQSKELPVEILVMVENKTNSTGMKRNKLIELAQGNYIVFIDDDDRIDPDYVYSLLKGIEENHDADCITFDVLIDVPDLNIRKIVKYGIEYSFGEDDQFYYRKPNHLMCYKRKLALQHKFADITVGEDDEWAKRANEDILKQVRVPRILYYYDCKHTSSPINKFNYANGLVGEGHNEKATKFYLGFLENNDGFLSESIESCSKLADCYNNMGFQEKSFDWLVEPLKYDIPKPAICYRIGSNFLDKHNYETAIYWFNKASFSTADDLLDPHIIWMAYLQLCVCYSRLDKNELANEYNEKAAQFQPTHPSILYNRKYFSDILK